MTDLELREKASAIDAQLKDASIPDEAIIAQIRETPELVRVKLKTGMNLFVSAIRWDRFPVAKALSDMGADIHWTCAACQGNALNTACSPQQADGLLALGVEIERNLLLSKPFQNPAVVAAGNNDKTMLFYWLEKQKELFADDAAYVRELLYAVINMVSMTNQYDTLALVMADEELFPILKDVYSRLDNVKSIQLRLGALRWINDTSLDARKKELRKVLNAKKKELSALT